MYKILLARDAEKEYTRLFKLNRNIFERVSNALRAIAEDPHQGKPLKLTLKGLWSYRVGSYRIIYSIEREHLIVNIIDIGHRKEVYR